MHSLSVRLKTKSKEKLIGGDHSNKQGSLDYK